MRVNLKTKMKNEKIKAVGGYSLFEILIVVVIFAILVFIANQTFISALRSGTKTDVATRVKENSNYVFSVMERQLHSARKITACSPATSSDDKQITYLDSHGITATMSCRNVGIAGDVASGSALASPIPISSSDVAVTACTITCDATNAVTTVNVNLTLTQAGSSAGLRPEEQDLFQAQTKITLRNN